MPAGRRRYKTALLFGGFGDGGVRYIRAAAAKEKSQMPGAALAAAERPQKQEKQDGPFQDAAPVRPQNIFTSTERALPSSNPKRDCMRSGHFLQYIVNR
jgi:hypothetical protein